MQTENNRPSDSNLSDPLGVDSGTVASDPIRDAVRFPADEFQNYQLLSLIHSGKSGDVFKVRRIGLNKTFALKVFAAETWATLGSDDRFERESKAIASLTHENLSVVYEHGKSPNGTPFIVTDFVHGASLEQIVQSEGALNDARVLDISLQLCSLLDYLEQKGIAVRGLDPSDVLVTKNETGAEVVKVVDLGIAKIFASTAGDGHWSDSSKQSVADFDQKLTIKDLSDSFSYPDVRMLGGLMFRLLTGECFSQCQNPNQALLADDPARATRIVLDKDSSAIKRDVRLAAAGALQMTAATQYRTIQDLHRALENVAKGEALAPAKVSENSNKRKKVVAIALGIAISGALILIPLLSHPANTSVTKITDATVEQPKTYSGSQQIKDNYGRVLYASNAPDQSACVTEALRLGINLAGAQLTNVHVSGVRVENISLANANFKDCSLFACTLSGVNLDGATFSGCKLTRMKFNKDTLVSAKFNSCNFNSTTFTDSKLPEAKFETCETGSTVRKGKLSGITFKACEMNGVHLNGGNWSNSKLLSPMHDVVATFNLSNSVIACTSLRGSDFSGATIVSSKIIAPDAKSLKFKSSRDTTVENKFPEVEKKIGEVK